MAELKNKILLYSRKRPEEMDAFQRESVLKNWEADEITWIDMNEQDTNGAEMFWYKYAKEDRNRILIIVEQSHECPAELPMIYIPLVQTISYKCR